MHALLLLAAVIAFFCDRFLGSRLIFYSSHAVSYAISQSFGVFVARFQLRGLFLFLLSFLSATTVGFFLFIVYHTNFVLYLVMMILLYLLLVPFNSFISDYFAVGSLSYEEALEKVSPWMELYGPISTKEIQDDHSQLLLCSGLVFERIIVAPLLWSIVFGAWGLLFYFFIHRSRVFFREQHLESSFFSNLAELVDWVPSRFTILLLCMFTHFSHFFDRITWCSYPSKSGNCEEFVLSALGLFLRGDSSLSEGRDFDLGKVINVFSRSYRAVMIFISSLLIIQATILF